MWQNSRLTSFFHGTLLAASLADQLEIVDAYEAEAPTATLLKDNDRMDESTIHHIIRRYLRFWKQRLLSHSIPIGSVSALVNQCFLHFSRQFMQIKRTLNYLFVNTT